jgi:hypothetical protein
MASKTGSQLFLIKKKIGMVLSQIIPTFKPLYTMVAFTPEIGYKEALDTHRKQERIVSNLTNVGLLTFTGLSSFLLYKYVLPENFIQENFKKLKDYLKI